MNELLRDRVPPQSIEAEQVVLGSTFLDADVPTEVMGYVKPKDFYRRSYQLIFQAMMTLSDQNEAIGVVTIRGRLGQENLLEDVGGPSHLSDLTLAVSTAANVIYYAKIVEQKSLLCSLIQTATEIVTRGFEQGEDVESILDDAEWSILEVSEKRNRSGFLSISDVLDITIVNTDQLYQNDREITGLPTGYQALDKMTAGLQTKELIIPTARPAAGKTAFALNIA